MFCHFFSSLRPFISPAATAQVKKKRGGKGRAKAADDDDEDVFGGEAAACCNEHGWEAGPFPASVCAPPMCTNGHNAARCLTPPRPIPPRCDAGEGLVQEQASPTKSGEEGEGEEEQDLEELDPVALQKKVGSGAVAWGHPCERFRKLWAGLQEQADTAIRLWNVCLTSSQCPLTPDAAQGNEAQGAGHHPQGRLDGQGGRRRARPRTRAGQRRRQGRRRGPRQRARPRKEVMGRLEAAALPPNCLEH